MGAIAWEAFFRLDNVIGGVLEIEDDFQEELARITALTHKRKKGGELIGIEFLVLAGRFLSPEESPWLEAEETGFVEQKIPDSVGIKQERDGTLSFVQGGAKYRIHLKGSETAKKLLAVPVLSVD